MNRAVILVCAGRRERARPGPLLLRWGVRAVVEENAVTDAGLATIAIAGAGIPRPGDFGADRNRRRGGIEVIVRDADVTARRRRIVLRGRIPRVVIVA